MEEPGAGYCPWDHKELDTTERLHFHLPYAKMRASLVAQLVKYPPAMQRPGFDPWVGKIPRRREGLPTLVFLPVEFYVQMSLGGLQAMGSETVGHN